MIKVGQIREDVYELYVITHYRIENSLYSVIYQNGETTTWSASSLEDDKLIAEYNTWQEAVNSPEFRGEK